MSDTVVTQEFSWLNFLFSFKGRISRKQFWQMLALQLFLLVAAYGLIVLGNRLESLLMARLLASMGFILGFVSLWSATAAEAKRWHDHNITGWCVLVKFIPAFGPLIFFYYCGIRPGPNDESDYGPDPLLPTHPPA